MVAKAYSSLSRRERAGGESSPKLWLGQKAPHPHPLPEGRGHVKLCPLRRRRRGERASPCADAVAPEGTRKSRMPSSADVAVRHLLMTADTVGGVWTYALELA